MNKILKVKIKRTQDSSGTHYTYPAFYVAEKFKVIIYETLLEGKYDDVVNRGNDYEFVIGIVDEKDLAFFLQSSDIIEIDRIEAEQFIGNDLDKSETIITDSKKVLIVLSKVAIDQVLTNDDKKVLDPNDVTTGVNKTKTLSEALDEYGV